MTDVGKPNTRRSRVTLDGQLVSFWDREALRLDALAAAARWSWTARRYVRKAAWARAQGERSRAREAGRTGDDTTSDG